MAAYSIAGSRGFVAAGRDWPWAARDDVAGTVASDYSRDDDTKNSVGLSGGDGDFAAAAAAAALAEDHPREARLGSPLSCAQVVAPLVAVG